VRLVRLGNKVKLSHHLVLDAFVLQQLGDGIEQIFALDVVANLASPDKGDQVQNRVIGAGPWAMVADFCI
jgi:hypothetical protein